MSDTSQRDWRQAQWRMLGNWEPKRFLYRRGDGSFLDVEQLWEQAHGHRAIERMAELGINVSHIHFHKGYGLQHEEQSIAEAREWAQRLHAAGIKVGVYIGCTLFTETFNPALLEQMSAQGQAIGWSAAQYFRRFWCWNNPIALDYIKQVIRVAIEHVKADVLHLDSGFAFSHDQLCHCPHCIDAFRKFVREEIPQVIRAAGYRSADHLSPPPAGNLAYLRTVHEMREPGDIAWTLFHAQAGIRALQHLADVARQMAPDITIFYNGANLAGITPYSRPNMEIQALQHVDATAVEDDLENPVGLAVEGFPVSRFRAYKAAARRGSRVYYYTSGAKYDARLPLAEAAAFNHACLGMIELAMQVNRRIKNRRELHFLQYLVSNEALFLDRTQWHSIAVVRHHESMLLNPFPSALSPYVIEQMLFEHHDAFGIIGGDELQRGERLSDFEGLILPDSRCISDDEAANIARFVKAGGWLLSIGNTGRSTPLNQFRSAWALAPIFGRDLQHAGQATYEEVAAAAARDTGGNGVQVLSSTFGRGRAMHIPQLRFDLPDTSSLNQFYGFPWYYHPYWRPPLNAEQILAALDELQGERRRVRTDLPRQVGLECYRIAGGWRFHFVNFEPDKPVQPFGISILTGKGPVASARWRTPEADQSLDVSDARQRLEISCPGFDVLATLTVFV